MGPRFSHSAALALALALATPAAAQQTFNLTIGASLPEVFPLISPLKTFVVPEVNKRLAAEGKYRINWREAYNGQLFKSNASVTSLQDGITDLAWVFVIFEGSRMPLAQASTFAPGVTSSDVAFETDWFMDWKINKNFTASFIAAFANPHDAIEQATGRTSNLRYGMVYLAYSY